MNIPSRASRYFHVYGEKSRFGIVGRLVLQILELLKRCQMDQNVNGMRFEVLTAVTVEVTV